MYQMFNGNQMSPQLLSMLQGMQGQGGAGGPASAAPLPNMAPQINGAMPSTAPQLPQTQGVRGAGGMGGGAPAMGQQPGFFQNMFSSPSQFNQGVTALGSMNQGMGNAFSWLGNQFNPASTSAALPKPGGMANLGTQIGSAAQQTVQSPTFLAMMANLI